MVPTDYVDPQHPSYGNLASGGGLGEGDDKRGKRRSKNDVDGRDYMCRYCDKTYLSYPALYTH